MLPRVLIVEDDEIIREIYALKFELEGFIIAVARDGREGLSMVREFQPQVVLLDMMMPIMGGIEFLKRLSPLRPPDCEEIIIFSNLSAPSQVQAVLQLGASAYWVKSDYTPDRVVRELSRRWKARHKIS